LYWVLRDGATVEATPARQFNVPASVQREHNRDSAFFDNSKSLARDLKSFQARKLRSSPADFSGRRRGARFDGLRSRADSCHAAARFHLIEIKLPANLCTGVHVRYCAQQSRA
jgi:hypothetical protein